LNPETMLKLFLVLKRVLLVWLWRWSTMSWS